MTGQGRREGTAPRTPTRRSRVRAVAVGGGLTVAALLVSLLGGVAFVIPLLVYGVDVASTAAFLVLMAAGQVGFLAVACAYHRRHPELGVTARVPTGRDLGVAGLGTVVALVVATGLSVAVSALDLAPGSVIDDAGSVDPSVFLGLAVLSVLLVAPAEEYLFRGVVQGRLRRAFGPVGAVAGSSLLFGSVHLANYTGSFAAVVAGALLVATTGTVLGAVYEYTGNLAVPVAVHALYNASLLLLAYAMV